MTVTIVEGFDYYPSALNTVSNGLQANWLTQVGNLNPPHLQAGRFGGQGLYFAPVGSGANTSIQRSVITSTNVAAMGTAVMIQELAVTATTNNGLYGVANGNALTGTKIAGVGISTTGELYLWIGDPLTITAHSGFFFTSGAWHYIELEINIDPAGYAKVWVDGGLLINYTGNTGTAAITTFCIGLMETGFVVAQNNGVVYDDVYYNPTNTRLGERKVVTLTATGDDAVAWTPSTGSTNFNLVNHVPIPASPTTWVSTSTVGTTDLYAMGNLPGTPTAIDAIQINVCAAKDQPSLRQVQSVLKSGATTVLGNTQTLAASYLYGQTIFGSDPNTSGAWTAAAVNAAEIGQKLQT